MIIATAGGLVSPMHIVIGTVGLALVAIILADAFQTVIVARHGQKIPAITRMFYRLSWSLFTTVAARIASRRFDLGQS